ncbi:hypothetical protein [Pseudomonas lactucae]|uniref:hypothetical protein n=1 Tax=Pseudomonas lactucae TaxID=2813360 RepID=UPI00112F3B20
MLRLLKKYLELADQPVLKSFIFTLISFLLCILPVLFIIAGEMILFAIQCLLARLPSFDFGVIQWVLRAIAWVIENITLLAVPGLIAALGALYLSYFTRRASIRLMIATYIFKRATEPLLAFHFAALMVKWLISFEALYALDSLLNKLGVQFTVGSGQMVTVTLVMWFLLTLGLHLQLKIIRNEKAKAGQPDILESIRLLLLDRINDALPDKKSRS